VRVRDAAAATIHDTDDSTGPAGDGVSRDLPGLSEVASRGGVAIAATRLAVRCVAGGRGCDAGRVLRRGAVCPTGEPAAESTGSALATPIPNPVIPAPMPSASAKALILLA